jgi:hypothetical protein
MLVPNKSYKAFADTAKIIFTGSLPPSLTYSEYFIPKRFAKEVEEEKDEAEEVRRESVDSKPSLALLSKDLDAETRKKLALELYEKKKEAEKSKLEAVNGAGAATGTGASTSDDRKSLLEALKKENPVKSTTLGGVEKNTIARIMGYDPLAVLKSMDKATLWKHRLYCKDHPRALSKFLKSIHWESNEQVRTVASLLSKWSAPSPPISIIELLDHHFADHYTRLHAIQYLSTLPDALLVKFVPQLAQSLKFEPYYDSPLFRFLLGRALLNPLVVGIQLFWAWTVEADNPTYGLRFVYVLASML